MLHLHHKVAMFNKCNRSSNALSVYTRRGKSCNYRNTQVEQFIVPVVQPAAGHIRRRQAVPHLVIGEGFIGQVRIIRACKPVQLVIAVGIDSVLGKNMGRPLEAVSGEYHLCTHWMSEIFYSDAVINFEKYS